MNGQVSSASSRITRTGDPGQTFLLGTIRHNNLPIGQAAAPAVLASLLRLEPEYKFHRPHSWGPGRSLPLSTTRPITPWLRRSAACSQGNLPTSRRMACQLLLSSVWSRLGWDATQRLNSQLPVTTSCLIPTVCPVSYASGDHRSAYRPDPVNAADLSRVTLTARIPFWTHVHRQYVGGGSSHDLYSRVLQRRCGQPHDQLVKEEVTPRTYNGARRVTSVNPTSLTPSNWRRPSPTEDLYAERTHRLPVGVCPCGERDQFPDPENFNSIPIAARPPFQRMPSPRTTS